MNLYDATTTYPPPTTSMPPPPTTTAGTGAPSSISLMAPAILVLVVVGASAIRIASNRVRRFQEGG